MGILAMARHGAGVGGTGIVTLWLQKKHGINAGRTQVMIDGVILLLALGLLLGTGSAEAGRELPSGML
ncbi:hypothetical protein LTR94_037854, partial [Friedmanniomyces endolithicus]